VGRIDWKINKAQLFQTQDVTKCVVLAKSFQNMLLYLCCIRSRERFDYSNRLGDCFCVRHCHHHGLFWSLAGRLPNWCTHEETGLALCKRRDATLNDSRRNDKTRALNHVFATT